MDEQVIHVHIPTDRWTTKYLEFAWTTMLRLAAEPEHIYLHAHCIGPSAVDILKHLKQARAHHVISATEGGSSGHAVCIMDAFSEITDNCIHVICDSDAFVVAKGWDTLLRIKASEGIGIMGSTYEELGGINSGTGHVQTYKQVPTFTWCAIPGALGHPWRTLNVMPNKDHRIHVENESMSKIYNLPVGHIVFGEAGYQLPKFIYDHNIKYEGWKQLKPSKDAVVLKGLSDYHEEFHVDGIPFVVHHRGSLRHRYRESRLSKEFFQRVDAWIDNQEPTSPRWVSENSKKHIEPIQLTFPFESPDVKRELPKLDVEPSGWMKVTIDGSVFRPRSPMNDRMYVLKYVVTRGNIHHVRIEGNLNYPLYVEVPDFSQHSVMIKNMTNVSIVVQKDQTSTISRVMSGTATMFLVDADGITTVY